MNTVSRALTASFFLLSATSCIISSSSKNAGSDGGLGFGGAGGYTQPATGGSGGAGGSTAGTCNSVLFDNGNTSACTSPTDTSEFTLSATSRVTALKIWVDTSVAGSSLQYLLLNSSNSLLSSGALTEVSCDTYQSNWCQLVAYVSLTLPAGSYSLRNSAVATCSNSGSSGVGFIIVEGCIGGSAGTGGAAGTGGTGGSSGSGGTMVAGTANRYCDTPAVCLEYKNYPNTHAFTEEQTMCSQMGGSLATGLCSGTFCGTCLWNIAPGITSSARYKTPCPPTLSSICSQAGATYTAY